MARRWTTRRTGTAAVLAALATASWALGSGTTAAGADEEGGPATVLHADTLVGVPAGFTGEAGKVRGLPGGGLPWSIGPAQVHLDAQGLLRVEVEDLVLADVEAVPEALRGTNPVPSFLAVVSCRTLSRHGVPVTRKVATDPFPASPEGDARVEARVDLPSPCLAPVVLVTSPTQSWFASTGG